MKNILIICGPSGSGKGTIISYLEKELSSAVFCPSDLSSDITLIYRCSDIEKVVEIYDRHFSDMDFWKERL